MKPNKNLTNKTKLTKIFLFKVVNIVIRKCENKSVNERTKRFHLASSRTTIIRTTSHS